MINLSLDIKNTIKNTVSNSEDELSVSAIKREAVKLYEQLASVQVTEIQRGGNILIYYTIPSLLMFSNLTAKYQQCDL